MTVNAIMRKNNYNLLDFGNLQDRFIDTGMFMMVYHALDDVIYLLYTQV